MEKVNWILDEDVEEGDPLDYRAKGKIIDSNGHGIDWAVAARPKYGTDLYIGQVRMRVGFALMDIKRQDNFMDADAAMAFVETELDSIYSRCDGLVKSQIQEVLLEMIK